MQKNRNKSNPDPKNYTMCAATIVNVPSFGRASSNVASRKTSNKVRFQKFSGLRSYDCAALSSDNAPRIAKLCVRSVPSLHSSACTTAFDRLRKFLCAIPAAGLYNSATHPGNPNPSEVEIDTGCPQVYDDIKITTSHQQDTGCPQR